MTLDTPREVPPAFGSPVQITHRTASGYVVACEHASREIPAAFVGLGLDEAVRASHIAWDPGALGVAEALAARLDAALVRARLSRLLYDCNRPPEAEDAIAEVSEVHRIPGNAALSPRARGERIAGIYEPFHTALAESLAAQSRAPILITVHSFTPIYKGEPRAVEIGILHGQDSRLATRMLATAPADSPFLTRLNEPYGPADGVAHTMDRHGAAGGIPSVMIEIRNDLLESAAEQVAMADLLAPWIRRARRALEDGLGVELTARSGA